MDRASINQLAASNSSPGSCNIVLKASVMPIEVEDKDIGSLLALPPISFISVYKVVIGSRKESLPSIMLAILNTKSIYYSKLDK